MRFLFPGFLFALFAIAVPVIIHLFNFRKFKKVYFSNVSFLKEIEQKTSSSRQLRDLLLLLMRVLAIIFLAFAFARPYLPSKTGSMAARQQVVSVYIDNSYSMEAINRDGSLLDEAKRRAKEVASAYGMNDKFQLLTNDFEGKHQRLMNYDDFAAAVDGIKISGAMRTLDQVISRQQGSFAGEPNARKTVYAISDFQKNMLAKEQAAVDSGVSVRLVRLSASDLPNISVDSVWFVSQVHRPGDQEKLVVQLRNSSDKKAVNVPLKLTIDKQQKAIASLSIEARGISRDTLSFSGLQAGWKQGEIEITDYPVVFDDHFHFTFYVESQMRILAINEGAPNPYLQAVYHADPFFYLINTNSGSIDYSALGSYPLVILNEAKTVSDGLAKQLKTYVEYGGDLMIFPSAGDDLTGLKILTSTLGTDIPERLVREDIKVTAINLQHPLFRDVFERMPANMDLPEAKSYVQYTNRSRSSRRGIMESPGRRMFLSQYDIGAGRVYLSAVALNEQQSNLVRHSLFVPFMYQAAFLSSRDPRLFYTIGKDQFLQSSRITLSPNQTLKLKKEGFEAIPDTRQNENGTLLFIADQVREQGNYSLLKADSLLALYAFNENRSESDMSYVSDQELRNKFPGMDMEVFKPGKESVDNAIKAANYGVQLWKLCLILALVFLAAEIIIIRYYKPGETR